MAGRTGKFGVALFGVGRAGTIHFTNIIQRRRLDLLYLVDVFPERGEQLLEKNFMSADQTKVIPFQDCQQVFDDKNVAFVVVTTPTDQHEEIVRRALDSGKAVFCEKPIALDRSVADQLYEKAESHSIPLYCAFQRRFDPNMSRIHDEVRGGKYGEVEMITTFSRDGQLAPMDYYRQSGGIFVDCAVHDIDMVCWIANEKPDSVFVRGTARHPEIKAMGDVDSVAIILTFPSGVLATIHLSRHSTYNYDQRLEVKCTQGLLQCGNVSPDIVQCFQSEAIKSTLPHESFPQRYAEAYAAELDHFIDVLSGSVPRISVTREDVRWVSEIATACGTSLRSECPVKLPLTQ
eukprot:scpid68075/ scgid23656/ Uncharacterized oxidoreductase YrbE